jgi:hypothetical protein
LSPSLKESQGEEEEEGKERSIMSGYMPPLLNPDEQAKHSEVPMAVASLPTATAAIPQGQAVYSMPTAMATVQAQPTYAQPMYAQPQPQPVHVQVQAVQYQQNMAQPSLGMDTFCSCFEDFGEACLCFWTCGCVSFGQTAERIGRTNCCAGGFMYALVVVIIPYFFLMPLFADPPTAEQLNFPPCYHPPVMGGPMGEQPMGGHAMHDREMERNGYTKEDKYGMHATNSSCPSNQLLETQCSALNDVYNSWSMPFDQRVAQAQPNYNRFCPSAQEAVGAILSGSVSAAFLIHSRVYVAHALGITNDAETKQFAAIVYSLGTRGLFSCLCLRLCLRHPHSQG